MCTNFSGDDHICNTPVKIVATKISPSSTSLINESFVEVILRTPLKKSKDDPIHSRDPNLKTTIGQYLC